jgi:hypothetical protein
MLKDVNSKVTIAYRKRMTSEEVYSIRGTNAKRVVFQLASIYRGIMRQVAGEPIAKKVKQVISQQHFTTLLFLFNE